MPVKMSDEREVDGESNLNFIDWKRCWYRDTENMLGELYLKNLPASTNNFRLQLRIIGQN